MTRDKEIPKKLRVVLAQLNLCVGDIEKNLKKHIEAVNAAVEQLSADVIVFPELSLTGYPPEDLLFRNAFIDEAESALKQFISTTKNVYCVVGHPQRTPKGLYNACSLIYNHMLLGTYAKQRLPNYEVFDEDRYFIPGTSSCVIPIHGIPTALIICEDLWSSKAAKHAKEKGARLILSPNASPFEMDKHERRSRVVSKRAKENNVPVVYVNLIGGQDELVFDGGSMVIDASGELKQSAGFFHEALFTVDIQFEDQKTDVAPSPIHLPSKEEKVYHALVLGLRDYIEKNHFPGVLVGVSGGIDSALTLAIAVDALGKKRVKGIMMPSRYTAEMSIEDATTLMKNLGVSSETISIEPPYKSFLSSLAPIFTDKKIGVTEENIQSRTRAVILMALSNASGNLVLTTGNRSELAVGYCTLYGDMAGGFAVLKDVPKTLVYELAHYRNQQKAVIPQRIIDRPPTAELAPNQKDQDLLPPYPILDQILERYLNQGQSIPEIVAAGFDEAMVKKIVRLVYKSEYKRKQAAIGVRINHKSFGKDWRYPVTNGFKG